MPIAITKDDAKIYYEVSGKGDPLLLIAGQASDHHIWNLVRGNFARDYLVIVYDQRGTGQSDKPESPPYATQGFARDAVAILDHLKVQRAQVYGYSMGGAIGQWMGIEHSDRVGSLVLGCSYPGKAHGVRRSAEIAALLAQPDQFKVMDLFFSHRRAMPSFFMSMRESVKQPMPNYAERLHAQASEEHETWERLSEITAPTLIIHGSDDKVVPIENAHLLAKRIPGAELQLVKGGRHMFFIEYRNMVDRIVKKFLASHPLN